MAPPPPPHSSSSRREPSSSSSPSPITRNPTTSPSPPDHSTRRLSKDSEGYPSWLPKRPPPPAPASTLGAASHIHFGETPSPVEGYDTYGEFGEFGEDVFGRGGDGFLSAEPEGNVRAGAEADARADVDAEADYGYPAYAFDHDHEHELGLDPRRRPQPQERVGENIGGRKPTPRSVRIVSLHDSFVGAVETSEKGKGSHGNTSREPTDQTLIGLGGRGARGKVNAPAAARVFTRASYPMTNNPTAFLPSSDQPMSPYAYAQGFPNASGHRPPAQPRFRAKNLSLQILLNPSKWMKLYFWLWPALVFYHVPLQTFFDFNAVFVLVQVSKFPSSSSSRKNWALAAAAYIACWLAWILFVCVMYELVYSFTRRWRLRRPLMLPIFLSSPAFNLAAMTSYTTFSFLQHLRISAFRRPEEAYLLRAAVGAAADQGSPHLEPEVGTDTEDVDLDSGLVHEGQRGAAEVDDGLDDEFTGEFGEIQGDEKQAASKVNASKPSDLRKQKQTVNSNTKPPSTTKEAKKPSAPIAWRQGLAETFFFYSQNVPTVALLLPRAGICLAVLFAFSSVPSTSFSSSINPSTGTTNRDGTFFRADGSLTSYARGVLIANAVWAAWRILVLCVSWLGLWYFSNQRLGGLCGPRHAWDEYAQEKTRARYSEAASEYEAYRASFYGNPGAYGGNGERRSDYGGDELAWPWRETTRMRVQDAFEFCVVTRRVRGVSAGPGQGLRWNTPSAVRPQRGENEAPKTQAKDKASGGGEGFEGIEKVLAAVGFGGGASPARRGVLSKDLFSGPPPKMGTLEIDSEPSTSTSKPFVPLILNTELEKPKVAKRNSKDKDVLGAGPITTLPYPFSRPGAGQMSSKDSVPFPAGSSGDPGKRRRSKTSGSKKSKSGSESGGNRSGSGSSKEAEEEEEEDEEEEDEEEEEEEDDEDDEEDEDEDEEESEEPSSGRASGSMSSLGQPISPSSRYHNPFGTTRRPTGAGHGRSMSGVSSALSSGTTGAGSVITQSTGNRESTDSGGHSQMAIPMPPRHPAAAAGGGRGRTGHVPVAFPSVQMRPRVNSGAGVVVDPSSAYGLDQQELDENDEEDNDDDDDNDEEERGEHEDRVGLLGLPSSARNSRISLSNTSSSGSGARSRTHSHHSVRSRTRTHSSSRGTPSSRSISAVRERASSLGASMRSIMQGAASASMTQLDNIMRGATGPAAGLGGPGGSGSSNGSGSGSRPRSRVNSSMARLEEDVVFDLPAVHHRQLHHHDDIEAYSSSGGTHSRSGSESLSHLSAENYTFGRPMTFARVPPPPSPVREQPEVPDSPIRVSAAEVVANSAPSLPVFGSLPQSLESQSFYSQDPDEGTVRPTPTGLPVSIPIPIHVSSSPADSTSAMTALSASPPSSSSDDHSQSHSERQGIPIPWTANASSRRAGSLVPPTPNTLALPPRNANMNINATATSSSGSPPDVSSAAGSFVTVPATLDTDSATISNNSHLSLSTVGVDDAFGVWGLPDPRQRRTSGNGGPLVDRPVQDMGAGGGGWHIM